MQFTEDLIKLIQLNQIWVLISSFEMLFLIWKFFFFRFQDICKFQLGFCQSTCVLHPLSPTSCVVHQFKLAKVGVSHRPREIPPDRSFRYTSVLHSFPSLSLNKICPWPSPISIKTALTMLTAQNPQRTDGFDSHPSKFQE